MGLDSVEILVEVEKTFGINIPDKEAEKIITIGDFHEAVWRHIENKNGRKCKSQLVFYKLRQSAGQRFNFPREDFRMETSPEEIFPQKNRRVVYSEFAEEVEFKLPELELRQPWSSILNWFGLITILGGAVFSLILVFFCGYTKIVFLIPLSGIAITLLFSKILGPMRTVIGPKSVREFTMKTLEKNFAQMAKKAGVSKQEVQFIVNNIVWEKSGVELEEITPDARIHDDLGID